MSSFSIIDDVDKVSKYRVVHVPIFSSSQGNWNKLLKPKGFSIVNSLCQTVLFTGYLSGFSIADNQAVEIKIRFNINGRADYTEESIKFFITTANVHRIIPINFVKTFTPTLLSPTLPPLTEIGLYDVYIYVNPTDVGSVDSYFMSDSKDVLYLNATFYHNNTTDDFSTPPYVYNPPPIISA